LSAPCLCEGGAVAELLVKGLVLHRSPTQRNAAAAECEGLLQRASGDHRNTMQGIHHSPLQGIFVAQRKGFTAADCKGWSHTGSGFVTAQ